MKFMNIKLVNFRNYKRLNLEFNPTKNIIIGENGEGKTNIVEALYVLSLSKSFRGSRDDVIIMNGCEETTIEGNVKDKYKDNYKLVLSKEGKKVFINKNKIDKISDYLSKINIVLFTSEDLKLIKDTPNTRRRLINIELSQYSNEYLKLLSQYNKVLKQRNAFLKMLRFNGNSSKSYLEILTNQMIEIGMKLHKYRVDFVNNISNYIENNYYRIAKKHGLVLSYKSDFMNKSKEDTPFWFYFADEEWKQNEVMKNVLRGIPDSEKDSIDNKDALALHPMLHATLDEVADDMMQQILDKLKTLKGNE